MPTLPAIEWDSDVHSARNKDARGLCLKYESMKALRCIDQTYFRHNFVVVVIQQRKWNVSRCKGHKKCRAAKNDQSINKINMHLIERFSFRITFDTQLKIALEPHELY